MARMFLGIAILSARIAEHMYTMCAMYSAMVTDIAQKMDVHYLT